MNDFVAELEACERRGFDVSQVHRYLSSTRIERESLDDYLKYRPDRYTRHLVYKNPIYEILVVCWGMGQCAPIHGHEGQYCWARVEAGSLKFTSYREVSEAPLLLEQTAESVVGSNGYLDGPVDIHSVENLLEFGAPAASVHVYYRPFSECDVYDLERREKRRVQMAYDSVASRVQQ